MDSSLPTWIPAGTARPSNITPVAWFAYPFDELASKFAARPSRDPKGGGAGPVRSFLLRISQRSMAEISEWSSRPGQIELSLPVSERGVVRWEHFEAVMRHVPVPLDEVHRQGAFRWQRRREARRAG